MVSLTKPAPDSTDFDAWLQQLELGWRAPQLELLRAAHALLTESAADTDAVLWAMAVADILLVLGADAEVAAAALLAADPVAATVAEERVEAELGGAVLNLVQGARALDFVGFQPGAGGSEQLEHLRQMFLVMARDVRAVLIKLAQRLHRLRRPGEADTETRRRLAQEALDVHAALANRLGVAQLKWELEDLALRQLEPETYARLARALDERRADRERYIRTVVQRLGHDLKAAGIHGEVGGRVKHIYSIWKKMRRKRLPFEEIFDVRAVRVLVDDVGECYAALGVVHALWNHIPKEFDDYIANPKENGYRSLHTAVVGPGGRTLEVQIRTREMHEQAELGVAAHWRYKEGGSGARGGIERQINWLRQMLEWREEDASSEDVFDRFKAEALHDYIYVLTPRGAIMELPLGATPLDFAYHVHTEVGHRCRGAKVNGRIVPLTYQLHSGEQVEILTAKQGGPSRDWINPASGYLATPRARAKARHWFRLQDYEQNVQAGRTLVEREIHRLGLRQIAHERIAERLGYPSLEELFAAIGQGSVTSGQIAGALQHLAHAAMPAPTPPPPGRRRASTPPAGAAVQVRGVGDLLTQMAGCCKPIPDDPIVGFITRGRGVSIHRRDCRNLLNLVARNRERVIDVEWGEEIGGLEVDVVVDAYDRQGLLRDITAVLANDKVNVLSVSSTTDRRAHRARVTLTVELTDLTMLSRLLDRITQLENVIEARRQT